MLLTFFDRTSYLATTYACPLSTPIRREVKYVSVLVPDFMTLLMSIHTAVLSEKETAVWASVVPSVEEVVVEMVDIVSSILAFRLNNCREVVFECGLHFIKLFRFVVFIPKAVHISINPLKLFLN